MKNRHSYGVLLLALLLCGSASAKVDSYIGGQVNLGEWTMLPSGSQYTGSLGAAGGVGFVYELRAGSVNSTTRFLFDVGFGAWGGRTTFKQAADMTVVLANQQDVTHQYHPQDHPETEYECYFDYVYELKGRRDNYNNIALQIPLLFGVQHKRFYMLAGAKLNAHVWTQDHMVATINTYGDYSRYGYGQHRNMPENQFFENKLKSSSAKTSLNIDVDLSLELGGRIGGTVTDAVGFDVPKDRVEYRLAVFADYGLFDLHTKGSNNVLNPSVYDTNKKSDNYIYDLSGKNESMISGATMNEIMSTTHFANAIVNNLMVGVKFTVLFRVPEPGKCVICWDSYGSSFGGVVRRGGVKYEE